jgi:hypothetical protein
VVEAIKSLCLKFPQKYPILMNFLSNILREEGGFEYKKAIVDSVLSLIRDIPDAKEAGLSHLCEFIEDCEFTYLSTQILHLLGQLGPSTQVRQSPRAKRLLVRLEAREERGVPRARAVWCWQHPSYSDEVVANAASILQ